MKNCILAITCMLAISTLAAQAQDSTYAVTSKGTTELLNKRYHVKAWVEYVKGSGHVLKFTSDVSFAKAVVMRWKKNAQGKPVSDEQTITFNPHSQSFSFMLDSPAYQGGLQYDVLLFVNAADKENAWRIHLLKK